MSNKGPIAFQMTWKNKDTHKLKKKFCVAYFKFDNIM